MKNIYRISNFLRIAVVMLIASTFLMSGSATFLNQIKEKDYFRNVLPTSSMGGNIIYVDDDNIEGPWDGSEDYPYQYIQDGIDNANNEDKIYVFNGTYYENIVIFKSVTIEGQSKHQTIIDGMEKGNVVKITVNKSTLTGFTIRNSGFNPNNAGISINSEENLIMYNNIINNNFGIRLDSPKNKIVYNNFFENVEHAYDESANIWYDSCPGGGNYWEGHMGEDDNEDGIIDAAYNITGGSNKDLRPLLHIYGSVKNLNTCKIFLTINYAIKDFETIDGHTIYVKNDVYYEHIYIYKALNLIGENREETIIDAREYGNTVKISKEKVTFSGFTVKNACDEIYYAGILLNSNEVVISDNIIENNYNGVIFCYSSDDNIISGNIIRNNDWNGISINKFCNKNIIIENNFENNDYAGIAITDTSENKIYHNNFIGNRHNAYDNSNNIWDDGYPSGGNYWDDYKGKDKDRDGIGDISYPIPDGINEDRYPLIEPYIGEDTIPPYVKIVSPENGLYIRNRRVFPWMITLRTIIIGRIDIKVEASDIQSGIDSVEFYLDNNRFPEEVDYDEPYIWTWPRGSILNVRYWHIVRAVAYDSAGNYDSDAILVRKFF